MIDKNIFKDILPFKKYLYLALLSDAVQAVLAASASYIAAYLADRMLAAEIDIAAATPFLALLLFFLATKSYLTHYNRIKIEKISQSVQKKLRLRLLAALAQREALSDSRLQGQWLALLTRGVDRLDVYISSFLPQMGILIVFPIVLSSALSSMTGFPV